MLKGKMKKYSGGNIKSMLQIRHIRRREKERLEKKLYGK
jgi:hypothetical protein